MKSSFSSFCFVKVAKHGPIQSCSEPLFVKMMGPVGQCALELPAQNKKMIPGLKWPSHAHLAFFSFVCDVMNSHL